jgi:hypothetical protein
MQLDNVSGIFLHARVLPRENDKNRVHAALMYEE